MNVFLWIVQILLALAFLAAGLMKVTQPKEKLQKNMGWVEDFSAGAVKGIGTAEILGAIGLILPAALKIAPVLTPLAAVGLVVVMIGAAVTHLRRGEGAQVPVPVVLLILAAVVAWGRFGPYAV